MHAEAATRAGGCVPLAHLLILHIGDKEIKWHSFGKSKHWHKTLPEIKDGIWYGRCSIIEWLNNKGETCMKMKLPNKNK